MTTYSERVNDISVIQLSTEGFEQLTEKQKQLTYFLSKAGLWGRMISLDQGSQYNIPLVSSFVSLYEQVPQDHPHYDDIAKSLFILFAHNGIYHSTTGKQLSLPINQVSLENLSDEGFDSANIISDIIFNNKLKTYRTIQKEGVDISDSGGNFYRDLTTQEVEDFRAKAYPKLDTDEIPPYGFNERLVKCNGEIKRQVISATGLYAEYVQKIIIELENALEYVENDKQHASISSLIKFYQTGDAADFDTHCINWTKDQDGDVYFINGLIESYEDPLGIGCTFESIVGFKNPIQTAKVNKIIENIQWFENNLPFDKKFKKEKASGLSASSLTVISMAGDTSPSLPLGINLPNSDWIRAKHGSKSVNLANVSSSRSSAEKVLREALFLPQYHNAIEKYSSITSTLHTDLHEIAGHGSGRMIDGNSTEDLKECYSIIEECRADLVALYFMANPKLREFGIYDQDVNVEEAALAEYVNYLTNGSFSQLRRIELGNDLTQAHFRNRQLISQWVLEHADKDKISMINKDGKVYIEVNDIYHAQELFGQLLCLIQEVKSTSQLDVARELIGKYGTKVDQNLHAAYLKRIEELDLPKVVCFNTPILVEQDNTIIIEQSTNFMEQQLSLFKEFYIPHKVLTKSNKI